MRNNAPVEHCVAEAFILHREIVLTMKASFTLRTYLMTKVARKSAIKNKICEAAALSFCSYIVRHPKPVSALYDCSDALVRQPHVLTEEMSGTEAISTAIHICTSRI